MGFFNQFRAIFRKNIFIWRRNLITSILELVLPVVVIISIVIIKLKVDENTYDEKSYIDDCSFAYYMDEYTKTYSNEEGKVWMGLCNSNLFSSCIEYKRTLFAIITDNMTLYNTIETYLLRGIFIKNFSFY